MAFCISSSVAFSNTFTPGLSYSKAMFCFLSFIQKLEAEKQGKLFVVAAILPKVNQFHNGYAGLVDKKKPGVPSLKRIKDYNDWGNRFNARNIFKKKDTTMELLGVYLFIWEYYKQYKIKGLKVNPENFICKTIEHYLKQLN